MVSGAANVRIDSLRSPILSCMRHHTHVFLQERIIHTPPVCLRTERQRRGLRRCSSFSLGEAADCSQSGVHTHLEACVRCEGRLQHVSDAPAPLLATRRYDAIALGAEEAKNPSAVPVGMLVAIFVVTIIYILMVRRN